ncbi:MAG: sugar ABC transporter ATP-binding protein [Dongiaceae bacterium]
MLEQLELSTTISRGDPTVPVLATRGIGKNFSGVRALDNVSIDVKAGEVHVLFGENGAGKSTLINILSGAIRPDEGAVLLDGQPIVLRSVAEARRAGIATVFQEFSLAPDLSVEENILLGLAPRRGIFIDRRARRSAAARLIASLGFDLNPSASVGSLSRGEQQMVEICKALSARLRVLILDEPTASLTDKEQRVLFDVLGRLKEGGVSIIYITHRIAEVQKIGDLITVLRDGSKVRTLPVDLANHRLLVELMTGRKPGGFFPTIPHRPGKAVLTLDRMSTVDGRVKDVSLEIREGEIVGLAGLVGCGKSEIGRACFGVSPIASGKMRYNGQPVDRIRPRRMLVGGVSYVPADRRREGIMPGRNLRENISISFLDLLTCVPGLLDRRRERRRARELASQMSVSPLDTEREITYYSGGNQQKSMIARYLGRDTQVFIFDEPTTGIDVGAKTQIYDFFKSLIERGIAIVLISSDIAEITNLCHRVYVVHNGSIRTHFVGEDITEPNILSAYFDQPPEA